LEVLGEKNRTKKTYEGREKKAREVLGLPIKKVELGVERARRFITWGGASTLRGLWRRRT